MSVITDRARTICETMRGDWRARFVFLMPRDRVLRVVSVPQACDAEFIAYVERESAAFIGLFQPRTMPEVLAQAIDTAWDSVPCGTPQVIDSTGTRR